MASGPSCNDGVAQDEPARTLLTYTQARERLGISRSVLFAWIAAKKLRVVRLPGKVRRIDERDLEAFISAHKR